MSYAISNHHLAMSYYTKPELGIQFREVESGHSETFKNRIFIFDYVLDVLDKTSPYFIEN